MQTYHIVKIDNIYYGYCSFESSNTHLKAQLINETDTKEDKLYKDSLVYMWITLVSEKSSSEDETIRLIKNKIERDKKDSLIGYIDFQISKEIIDLFNNHYPKLTFPQYEEIFLARNPQARLREKIK